MRSPASVLCPGESLSWRTMIRVGLTVALGLWEDGMVETEGTKLCLQLSRRVPWADCVLGLGLADSPMGVSAVTSQGAGREPYGRWEGARTHYCHCSWHTQEKGTRKLWVIELDL